MAPQGAERAESPIESVRSILTDARSPHRHSVPARQTSFIGRTTELAELADLLASSEYRLLTIIGPGGIGKTRLALEAAEATEPSFADGVAYASLQAVSPAESIVTVLAEALGYILKGQEDAREQVARFLYPLRLLLVLDNFEHLLDEALWLGELLAASPGLRMLVTSREALNLREEWRYPLTGLATPAEDEAGVPGKFEAVQLFVERARQTRRDFSLEAEREGVIRLCRITEGLPLALELAAAWTKTLTCDAIADEIERNIAFLSSDLRNVPARHRSMQAAFDHSLALLTEDERRVFQRLAVFQGGFRRDAGERVAGATLPLLSSLVDKSLVRAGPDGRFYLHELLRQYAEERLRADHKNATRTYSAHRDFYLAFAAARFLPITGGAQREAILEIATELDNIRGAWHDAVAVGDAAALGRAAHPLTVFFDCRARYQEGIAMLEEGLPVLRAAAGSAAGDRALAAMLVDIVRMNHRLAQVPAMRGVLTEAEERYARLAFPPPPGQMTDPQLWRALLTLIDGDYAAAERQSAEVIQRNAAEGRLGNLPAAWWLRAAAAMWQEDLEAAGEYARQCSVAALKVGDRWHLAYCRNQQGHIAMERRNYADARQHYEASYAIREEFDDPEGKGTALSHLAKIAALQGDLVEAERLYRTSLAIARHIGDQITLAHALNGLGLMACTSGDIDTAGRHFAEGLRLMSEAGLKRLLLTFLVSAGDWLLRTGQPVEAISALVVAHDNPASDRETRDRAEQLLAAVASQLPEAEYDALVERNRGHDPSELAAALIPLLTAPVPAGFGPVPSPPVPRQSATTPTLIEPLTERELSVLRLIAAGHTDLQIAHELFLAVNTIRSYNQRLYGKLGVSSRTQAVARARDLGLLN